MPPVNLPLTKQISLLFVLLAVVALACNAPIANQIPTPLPTATPSATSLSTQPLLQSPTAEPNDANQQTPTILPTFTPIPPATPTSPTSTATSTPTETTTSTPQATPTEKASSGPLSFTYTIVWEVSSNPGIAIATVTINAAGGGGGYQYFRDDLPVDGPIFQYQWATCRANPGSLRVDSADGQSVRTDYFETPPCPATP